MLLDKLKGFRYPREVNDLGGSGSKNRIAVGNRLYPAFSSRDEDAFEQFSASSEFDGVRHLLPMIWLAENKETRSVITHLQRIREGCHWLALKAGESEDYAHLLSLASIFHDIGMAWTDTQCEPTNWFTNDQAKCDRLKLHCLMGADFLKELSVPWAVLAAEIALDHHECWDGGGYPHARPGPQLSLAGRIVALVHFFEENTHPDPRGKRMQHEDWSVIEMISIAAGRYFDPRLSSYITDDPDGFTAAMGSFGLDGAKSSGSEEWNLISSDDCLIDLDLLLKQLPLSSSDR